MALPKFPTINQELLSQLRGLFFSKDNPIVLPNNGFIGLHSIDTPSELPPFPYRFLYQKGDGHFYFLDYEGNEYRISDSLSIVEHDHSSLQQGGTFDWVTWNPVVYQNGIVAANNLDTRYIIIGGNTIMYYCRISITGAGVGGNLIRIRNLPYNLNTGARIAIGTISITDSGTATYSGIVEPNGAINEIAFRSPHTNAYIGANPNFALANTDVIGFTMSYPLT